MRSERRLENVGPQKRAEISAVLNQTIIGMPFKKPTPGCGGPKGRAGWAGMEPTGASRGVPPHLCPALRDEAHVTGALHGPKHKLNLGHGCVPGPWTAQILCGQLPCLAAGMAVHGRARVWVQDVGKGRHGLRGL